VEPVYQIFRWKINPKSRNPCHLAKRLLFLFNINPQSQISKEILGFLKIILDMPLATTINYK
jgi:hypothetical protein